MSFENQQLKFLVAQKGNEFRFSMGYKNPLGKFIEVAYVANENEDDFLIEVDAKTDSVAYSKEPKLQNMTRYSKTESRITNDGAIEITGGLKNKVGTILNRKVLASA